MSRTHRRIAIAAAVVAALVAGILATRAASPPATPNPPGTFSFAVLGDAPYYWWEDLRFRIALRAIERHDLSAVIHVGDIFWKPCSDAMYRSFHDRFNGLGHPLIYTPGDNEWTDCWEPQSGGYSPLERLATLRRIFFADPSHSLGRKRIALQSQAGLIENARWQHEGVVFATVHLPGSRNGTKPFPGRTAADDAGAQRRLNGAIAWMRETFAEARARKAPAVVLAFHASLSLELPVGHDYRAPYEAFIVALEEEADRFGAPVLIVHGDDHEFLVDRPVAGLANLTRMEVPGSHDVGWVRVSVNPRAPSPFAFESHIVPRWKFW